MRWGFLLIAFFFALRGAAMPVRLILDTDIGPDYDDVGAMAVAHALADRGEAEILATVSCNRAPLCVPCIEILNRYYGRAALPIGTVSETGLSLSAGTGPETWPEVLVERYGKGIRYPVGKNAPDAVQVYRRILHSVPEKSVTIVSIGFMTNLAGLLRSGPDAESPLEGRTLIRNKVKCLVSMACHFPSGREWNVQKDPVSARAVFEGWPTPILCSGFEIGKRILTGKRLTALRGESPVKDPYRMMMAARKSDDAGRMSWDQTAVLVAVRGAGNYFGVEHGLVHVDGQGKNDWTADPQGPHARLLPKMPDEELTRVIEELMMSPPRIN